jgi:hypothetical protein
MQQEFMTFGFVAVKINPILRQVNTKVSGRFITSFFRKALPFTYVLVLAYQSTQNNGTEDNNI